MAPGDGDAQALPLPEVGLVLGVSDAALLRKAMTEYRKLFNDTVAAVRGNIPFVPVPDLTIPEPEETKGKGRHAVLLPLPEILAWTSASADCRPVAARGGADLSNDHAERLLEHKPAPDRRGPLPIRRNRSWPRPMWTRPAGDTLAAWLEFAVINGMEARGAPKIPGMDAKAILPQVRTIRQVAQVRAGQHDAPDVEDGVVVTHTETVIRDVKPDGREPSILPAAAARCDP